MPAVLAIGPAQAVSVSYGSPLRDAIPGLFFSIRLRDETSRPRNSPDSRAKPRVVEPRLIEKIDLPVSPRHAIAREACSTSSWSSCSAARALAPRPACGSAFSTRSVSFGPRSSSTPVACRASAVRRCDATNERTRSTVTAKIASRGALLRSSRAKEYTGSIEEIVERHTATPSSRAGPLRWPTPRRGACRETGTATGSIPARSSPS